MFETRSYKLERIDTGDYTPAEYERFLRDIRFINRFAGDGLAVRKTLLKEIEKENLREFSVLDVGAGSGEILRSITEFARKTNRKANLFGLDLNEISAKSIFAESEKFSEIKTIRADALTLPFADKCFDYAICSLFTHHFTDENVVKILAEMNRVARLGIFVIDLRRHRTAYALYKIFCVTFGISRLVREDGSLSILRGFRAEELKILGEKANLENISVKRHFPFRLVLQAALRKREKEKRRRGEEENG